MSFLPKFITKSGSVFDYCTAITDVFLCSAHYSHCNSLPNYLCAWAIHFKFPNAAWQLPEIEPVFLAMQGLPELLLAGWDRDRIPEEKKMSAGRANVFALQLWTPNCCVSGRYHRGACKMRSLLRMSARSFRRHDIMLMTRAHVQQRSSAQSWIGSTLLFPAGWGFAAGARFLSDKNRSTRWHTHARGNSVMFG